MGTARLEVLKKISLKVEEGEFIAIMGPSGSGKSTLMQIMGLLDRPTSGSYELMGQDVLGFSEDERATLRSRTIGFIFQMYNLLARTTALDNVILPMLYAGTTGRQARARKLLKDVGMEDRLFHKPNQLSGGQQQRVAVARALVNQPKILFADEPTGNLATKQSEEILERLKLLNQSGITVIMVTHEPDIAAHAKRIIHIKDGVIISDNTNEDVSPAPVLGPVSEIASVHTLHVKPPELSMSEFGEYGASALRAMGANRVRSGLSMLGILIGVSAVIAMLAVGKGAQKAIEERIERLGSNVIMLFAGSPSSRGVRGAAGTYSRLTLEDTKAIRMSSQYIVDIYPEAEGDVQIVYRDQNSVNEMQGVTPNYVSIRNAHPDNGRFFTEAENASSARVIVLCPNVVTRLFGSADPIGKMVRINHLDFRVIGTLPTNGPSSGDQDDMVFVPIKTAMKRVLGAQYLHEMAIQCANPDSIPAVIEEVERLMRHRHRLPEYKESDFTIRNNSDMQAALSGTTKTFASLLGSVAAISLLVGGVGIMNIMLVSVNERTREIGLRKAVGATSRAILIQFLIESALLSLTGGVAGIFLGTAISCAVSNFTGWIVIVTWQAVVLSFVSSTSIGIVFGFWPAKKASLLSPIEALRYE
jgi:macrolide transport system ATP-binding/permease protein